MTFVSIWIKKPSFDKYETFEQYLNLIELNFTTKGYN